MAAAPPTDRLPLIQPSSAAAAAAGSAPRQGRQQQLLSTGRCGLALLLFATTAAVAIVHNRRAPWRVAFQVGVSVNVVALLGALAAYHRAPPEDARRTRRKLKSAVWALATTLNLVYSLRAAPAASAAACFALGCTATFIAFAGAHMLFVEGSDGPVAGGDESLKVPAGGERRQWKPPSAWLVLLAMLFFFVNALVASIGQPWRVFVVVQVSANVLILFSRLGAYDGAPPEDVGRGFLSPVCVLATWLSVDFFFQTMESQN